MIHQSRIAPVASQQLQLFDAPHVDAGTLSIARGGLSHFRDQMRRYADCWPYLIPEWKAWIAYFERMASDGFDAAQAIKPRDEESEPSQMFAALTARHTDDAKRLAARGNDGSDQKNYTDDGCGIAHGQRRQKPVRILHEPR